jgi:hypothetical protein
MVPPCPLTPLIQVKGRTRPKQTCREAANAALRNATGAKDIRAWPIADAGFDLDLRHTRDCSRSTRPFRTETGSLPGLAFSQHTVERLEPLAAVRLVRHPFRP